MLIRDNESGTIHEYGDRHDALRIDEAGSCLYYSNLQNGDGSIGGGYSFVMEDGEVPGDSKTADAMHGQCFANIGGFEDAEKYKLALFATVRNSTVMPVGLQQGKSMKEINKMAVATCEEILKMCDFDGLREAYEEGTAK